MEILQTLEASFAVMAASWKEYPSMLIGQNPPMPDGSTPVEKLLYWAIGVAVVVVSYFYKALETKNAKRIEQLEVELAKCQAEHTKSDEKFQRLSEEISLIREQRYKTQ